MSMSPLFRSDSRRLASVSGLAAAISLASVIGLAGSAHAQVVTPPPAKNPGPTDHIPPAPPPVPMPARPASPVTPPPAPRPEGQPVAQPPVAQPMPRQARPVREALPDVPFESIVKRDDQGNVLPLTEPMELAALRATPTIDKDLFEKIGPYLKDRELTFERLAANNLDIVETIEAGFFSRVNFNQPMPQLQEELKVLRPIFPPAAPAALTTDLRTKGYITEPVARFSTSRVLQQYIDARLGISPDLTPEQRQAFGPKSLGFVIQMQTDELMFAYRAAARRALETFAASAAKAGLSEEVIAAAKPSLVGLTAETPADMAHKTYRDLTAGLTLDQRKALLNAAIEAR
jgi:hypothetical protein